MTRKVSDKAIEIEACQSPDDDKLVSPHLPVMQKGDPGIVRLRRILAKLIDEEYRGRHPFVEIPVQRLAQNLQVEAP